MGARKRATRGTTRSSANPANVPKSPRALARQRAYNELRRIGFSAKEARALRESKSRLSFVKDARKEKLPKETIRRYVTEKKELQQVVVKTAKARKERAKKTRAERIAEWSAWSKNASAISRGESGDPFPDEIVRTHDAIRAYMIAQGAPESEVDARRAWGLTYQFYVLEGFEIDDLEPAYEAY